MKKIIFILMLSPLAARAQTTSDTIKYLLAQITVLKSLIGMNQAADIRVDERLVSLERRTVVAEDSLKKYKTILIDTSNGLLFRNNTLSLKKPQ